jgi:hypothetical protein
MMCAPERRRENTGERCEDGADDYPNDRPFGLGGEQMYR